MFYQAGKGPKGDDKLSIDEESGAPLLQSTFFGGFYVTLLAATS